MINQYDRADPNPSLAQQAGNSGGYSTLDVFRNPDGSLTYRPQAGSNGGPSAGGGFPVSGGGGTLPSTPVGTGLANPIADPFAGVDSGGAFDAAGNFVGNSTVAGEAGGTGASILNAARGIGTALGGLESGRQAGRAATATANQNQALAEASLYRTRMDAALKGPSQSARDAALGDTLANIQPFSFTGGTHMVGNIPVPDASGGMTPANFGPNTRAAGQKLSTLGASRVNSPSFNLPPVPTLAPLPQANGVDTFLNGASTASTIAQAIPPDFWSWLGGL